MRYHSLYRKHLIVGFIGTLHGYGMRTKDIFICSEPVLVAYLGKSSVRLQDMTIMIVVMEPLR